MTHKIFVYGTLMQGLTNHHILKPYGKFIGLATLAGFRMLNIGQFPALVKSEQNEPLIQGELYGLHPATLAQAWASLDDLEDYPHLYDRQIVRVTLSTGMSAQAWVYIWQQEQDYPVITSGNYRLL